MPPFLERGEKVNGAFLHQIRQSLAKAEEKKWLFGGSDAETANHHLFGGLWEECGLWDSDEGKAMRVWDSDEGKAMLFWDSDEGIPVLLALVRWKASGGGLLLHFALTQLFFFFYVVAYMVYFYDNSFYI